MQYSPTPVNGVWWETLVEFSFNALVAATVWLSINVAVFSHDYIFGLHNLDIKKGCLYNCLIFFLFVVYLLYWQ